MIDLTVNAESAGVNLFGKTVSALQSGVVVSDDTVTSGTIDRKSVV